MSTACSSAPPRPATAGSPISTGRESFAKSWDKIRDFAEEAGKDPDTLLNASQLPIMIGKSRAGGARRR